jgi:type II restriction/modification system DNA methylase subunit YeeA
MNFINKKINSFINPLYSKFPVEKKPFVHFVNHLIEFNQKINFNETEEHNKNLLRDFLKSTLNSQDGHNFYINTSEQIDLAIHSDNSSDSPIAVIIEVKKPDNNYEMVTADNFYKKSFYELMLYYLREKIIKNNHSVKFLIITNLIDWFIFNSHDFERLFARNRTLLDDFKNWHSGGFDSTSTNHFYSKIAPDFLKNTNENIDFVHFSLKDFLLNELKETDISQIDLPEIQRDKLIELYKLLSPVTLLGVKFANDSNSLNKDFYNELLYILGLEEQTENGKKIINRLPPSKRINGTIIENTIEMILSEREEEIDEYLKQNNLTEKDKDEAVFSIALELVITWLNRILFLKLLEGQLVGYHNGNTEYKFLTKDNIEDYGVLNELFFDVLAVPIDSRKDDIKTKFANIPYLNSSLFEKTKFENDFIGINQLKNRYTIPVYAGTVLKDEFGNNIVGKQNTLNYLFDFLDAYDFSNVSNEKILEKNKTLINASVLGLIFEKINGYKDGSYFTPGFISMYTARETIRRIVLQKFNDKYNWNCNDFDDISNFIISNKNKQQILEYNSIINSITICDPAVGSGHFLVSCLNELIACKSDLGILADANGKILQIKVHIENDELIFTDFEGNLFEYNPKNQDSTYIQKSIFFEKQNLIENCIFGVDINSKSTQISRLRLWIELLKNTYYNENNQLETLPNIDINIKTGNSLISNYSLNSFTSVSVKDSYIVSQYKEHVKEYKNTINSKKKKQLLKDIENDKNNLKGFIISKSELELKLKALNEEYHQKYESQTLDIELSPEQKIVHKEKQHKLMNEIGKIAIEINKIKDLLEDKNKLEWRFEFPEVLDDLGNFLGFDIVIGNPPYIQLQKDGGKLAKLFEKQKFETFARTGDIYALFYEKGMQILKDNGLLSYITSNKWMRAGYGEKLRKFFLKYNPLLLIDLGPGVFENATVDTNILVLQKSKTNNINLKAVTLQTEKGSINIEKQVKERAVILEKLTSDAWFIGNVAEQRLKEKIERLGKPLKDWDVKIYRGVLTGLNEAFIITTEKRNEILANCKDEEERKRTEAIIKPILRGRDIKRYSYEWAGLWVIFIPWHFPLHEDASIQGASKIAEQEFQKQYPSVYSHLLNYKDKLSKRNKEETGIRYEWYALQRCAATYYPEFEKEKVVWGGVVTTKEFFKLRLSFLEKDVFINAPANFMVIDKIKYFLGYLNSYLNNWYYNNFIGTILHKEGIRFYIDDMFKIPLPPITPTNEQIISQIEALVDKILASKKANPQADTSPWEREIDKLVYLLYDLTEEEIEILENIK